jgi:arabinosyltransferase C
VLVGVLGVLVAVAVPFAPVIGQSTLVQWPPTGQPPRPSTAFFVPYRPAELHATVPCPVLLAALARPGRTSGLSTGAGAGTGLVIESAAGRARVASDGKLVPVALPVTGCDLRVDADRGGTAVWVGGSVLARLPGARVPEVFAFDTDLDASAAAGMAVTARTPYWFASTPTGWKLGLIAAQAVLVAAALVLLARHGRRSPRVPARCRRGRWVRGGVDGLALVVLASWGVLGPLTDDDGFAAMIARNAGAGGDTGNYYRWFNASEAPFALAQQVVRAFAEVSIAPLWLRVPSLLAGALTWLVLHRWVLPLALPRAGPPWLAGPLAAVFFLAWWLPYGLGTRPEPFVALGSTLVLALVLAATSRAVRRPLLALGLAALVAGLTAAVAPTGLLAAAPVLLSLPGIWVLLRERATGVEVAARVLLLCAIAAAGLTVMFADQSWHGVAVATDLHRAIGPSLPWFDEGLRYARLLGPDNWGSAGKRLPVLLTVALAVPVLVLLARHGRAVLPRREQLVLAGAPVGLLLLALTPSKWTHHFGALAGLGAAFLVVAVTALVTEARGRDPRTLAVGLGGGTLVALAAGLSFAGPNTWWAYSDFGMAFSDGPLWPLSNPLLWLAAAGAVLALWAGWRRRSPGPGGGRADVAGVGVAAVPAVLAVLAAATSVALLLATFLAAPLRRGDGYSLPAQNLAALRGSSCGIEDHVQVHQELPAGVLEPVPGVTRLDGFVAQGGYPAALAPPQPGARYLWGSATGDPLHTGSLRSAWFALPAPAAGSELAVGVAGRLGSGPGGGNTVAVEFGRSAPGGVVAPLGQHLLRDPEPAERGYAADAAARRRQQAQQPELLAWRTRTVRPPAGADRVRVLAVDGSVGESGWVAVTGPRRISVTGLRAFLDAHPPVLVDWPIAFVVPCRRVVPAVAGGLAQAPAAILAVPVSPHPVRDRWSGDAAQLAYSTADGGSFAGVCRVGRVRTLDSRLVGDEGRYWGSVQVIDYGMARDAYDTRTLRRWLPGWAGDGRYPFD